MKIIVDGFGGDFAPVSVLKGCSVALNSNPELEIVVTGDVSKLKKAASENEISISKLEFLNAETKIETTANPFSVLEKKADSSMAVGLKSLKDGLADAFVSAGNTGALTIGSYFLVGRIPKIKRAALAPIIPSASGKFLLLDAGANLECKTQTLLQFAQMGSIYFEKIFSKEKPKVGLANVGTEPSKGTDILRATFSALKENSQINFVGNIEARDAFTGKCDVIVTDGLNGNMILKTMEGTAKFISHCAKRAFTKSLKNKLAALLLKNSILKMKSEFNYKNFGGAALLGIAKPVIKAHGDSNAETFAKAILHAIKYSEQKIIETISQKYNINKGEEFKQNG